VKNKNVEVVFAAAAIMHLMLVCCMFCKSEKVKIINEGLWFFKLMVIALIALFLRLAVGTTFFVYLEYFSVWGANLLYLFIAIVFVDLSYAFDGYLDECAQENHKVYILKAILSITLLLTASFICFISFKHNPLYVSLINAIFIGIFLLLALLRVFPGNSILVSAIISLSVNIIGFYIKGDDTYE
jgi:hypothetical protein